MGLTYGEDVIILASTVFVWSTRLTDGRTDGQTDGMAIADTRYTTYAVARKNTVNVSVTITEACLYCTAISRRFGTNYQVF